MDADFAGDTSLMKSTTGYVLLLGTEVVQWYSQL